jgi:hypothetical protein
MAKKSSKHEDVQPVKMILDGGLNYSSTPANLADNELRRAHNFIYDPSTNFLVTRPGTTCKTLLKCDSTTPITNIYYYEKSSTVAYLVASCNGELYYLSGAGLDAWTSIGLLHDATTIPSFITFNAKLIIADGGSTLRSWDGTTYATIATSPDADALATIGNRIVANSVSEPDSVYLSKTKDETDWNVSGSAVGIKAGYGDNMSVKAFGVFNNDLMIFKKGESSKYVYRLNVEDATPANWQVALQSPNNTAQNAQATAEAWNNIFFVDSNGFKSIKGVDVYGDLQVDPMGKKINSIFTAGNNCDFMTYIPLYNTVWFGMGDRVFCYTERQNEEGQTEPAFTELAFQQGRIRAVCQAGDTVYLAGHNGYLYKLTEIGSTDETAPTVTSSYVSALRTKTLVFGGDGILKKLQWYLRPKAEGTAKLYVYKDEESEVKVKDITLTQAGDYLFDATGDLNDATGYLYDDGYYAWTETSRARLRNTQMAFEIYVTSGRVGVEWVRADIAMVEGG